LLQHTVGAKEKQKSRAEKRHKDELLTATHSNTLQHTATHYNTLQRTATHCNLLQHTVGAKEKQKSRAEQRHKDELDKIRELKSDDDKANWVHM